MTGGGIWLDRILRKGSNVTGWGKGLKGKRAEEERGRGTKNLGLADARTEREPPIVLQQRGRCNGR